MSSRADDAEKVDRQALILQAVIDLLARHGISGVSMRAVAREAGVALGLVSYHYEDKTSLIRAALHRVEEQDLAMVAPDPSRSATAQVGSALRRIAVPEFLTTEYLSLRLQLWALARAHPDFEEINTSAQARYREGLAALIEAARPDLSRAECRKRAADVDVVQNGVWLTTLLGLDDASVRRSIKRCEEIALGRGRRARRRGPPFRSRPLAVAVPRPTSTRGGRRRTCGRSSPTWQWVCHVERLAAPGSYVSATVAGMPIAVVRGRDGHLRAFYNVCKHRRTHCYRGRARHARSCAPTTPGPTT